MPYDGANRSGQESATHQGCAVSVVVPVYNRVELLSRCLETVRGSTFTDYELIVVDDHSDDISAAVARRFADRVIVQPTHQGRIAARKTGFAAARGAIIVGIDSDVLIRPDTLLRIVTYFATHPEVDALTGRLSKDYPYRDFFSDYKNLYMVYMFDQLPERVSFLYGSLLAIRDGIKYGYDPSLVPGEDTEFGQYLSSQGKQIAFVRDLAVTHLKRYSFSAWVRNDFAIPFGWGRIFIRYQGVKQLCGPGTRFAHSSQEQIISLLLAATAVAVFFLFPCAYGILAGILLVWGTVQRRFFRFLHRERGWLFAIVAVPVTFFDHLVMFFGILCGAGSMVWPIARNKAV